MKNQLNRFLGQHIFNMAHGFYDFLTDQKYWHRNIMQFKNQIENPENVRTIVDLGCGPGVSSFILSQEFPQAKIYGVDLQPNMVALAKKNLKIKFPEGSNIEFRVGNAQKLNFKENSIDLITGHSFLYLTLDPLNVLKEAQRILCPGGQALFMEPAKNGSLWALRKNKFNINTILSSINWEKFKFASSMIGWRLVSCIKGQLDEEQVAELFKKSHFSSSKCTSTLENLGLWCCGRK